MCGSRTVPRAWFPASFFLGLETVVTDFEFQVRNDVVLDQTISQSSPLACIAHSIVGRTEQTQ